MGLIDLTGPWMRPAFAPCRSSTRSMVSKVKRAAHEADSDDVDRGDGRCARGAWNSDRATQGSAGGNPVDDVSRDLRRHPPAGQDDSAHSKRGDRAARAA